MDEAKKKIGIFHKTFRNPFPLYVPMIMIFFPLYHVLGSALTLRTWKFLPMDSVNAFFFQSNTNPAVIGYIISELVFDFCILMLGILMLVYREKSSTS